MLRRSKRRDEWGDVDEFQLGIDPPYPIHWLLPGENPAPTAAVQALGDVCESSGLPMAFGPYGEILSASLDVVAQVVDDEGEVRDVLSLPGILGSAFRTHEEGLVAGIAHLAAQHPSLPAPMTDDRSVVALLGWYALYHHLEATLTVDLVVLVPPFDGQNVSEIEDASLLAIACADTIIASLHGQYDFDVLTLPEVINLRLKRLAEIAPIPRPPYF